MNIFTTELIQKDLTSKPSYSGERVERNGDIAMRIGPAPFWGGSETYGASNFKGCLRGCFEPNTQYQFNIWIDVDDIFYTGGNKQVPGGFSVVYTDGTKETHVRTGNISAPIGWQHILFTSAVGKSIDALSIYYWINTPGYYRYDSYIAKIDNGISILNNGIVLSNNLINYKNEKVQLFKDGTIKANDFYEL